MEVPELCVTRGRGIFFKLKGGVILGVAELINLRCYGVAFWGAPLLLAIAEYIGNLGCLKFIHLRGFTFGLRFGFRYVSLR